MSTQRKHYSAEFKARVAGEALKGHQTVNAGASAYGVHPTPITPWKHQLQQEVPQMFSARRATRAYDQEALQAQGYQQIGPLKVELDWLKKQLASSLETKRGLIDPDHRQMSVVRPCELVGLSRSSFDDVAHEASPEHLRFMRWLDEPYTRTPFDGVRRMTAWGRAQGYVVHHTRVARLLRTMGLETLDAKPCTSPSQPGHRIYPYGLRGVPITRVNQVWRTDITSIRLQGGLVYVVAILDWCSRDVLSWAVSITMDVGFGLDALEHAFGVAHPEVFHSDQGAQFTSTELTKRLETAGIRLSMDGRGRALDHVFVERLWRTVKYEEVYLQDDATPREAARGLEPYFGFYKSQRLHQALDDQTPAAVYVGSYL